MWRIQTRRAGNLRSVVSVRYKIGKTGEPQVFAANLKEIVPVTYKIDTDKRTVRTRCIGDVTLREVIDHFRALEQDPNCPELLDVFLDLSEMDSLPETREISMVSAEIKRIRSEVQFGACAILASRDAVVGMMRIFEVMAEECFRATSTFRVANEAEAWLASQQSSVDYKPDRAG